MEEVFTSLHFPVSEVEPEDKIWGEVSRESFLVFFASAFLHTLSWRSPETSQQLLQDVVNFIATKCCISR